MRQQKFEAALKTIADDAERALAAAFVRMEGADPRTPAGMLDIVTAGHDVCAVLIRIKQQAVEALARE